MTSTKAHRNVLLCSKCNETSSCFRFRRRSCLRIETSSLEDDLGWISISSIGDSGQEVDRDGETSIFERNEPFPVLGADFRTALFVSPNDTG